MFGSSDRTSEADVAQQVWDRHLEDHAALEAYAAAMHELAESHWKTADDRTDHVDRVAWSYQQISRYFTKELSKCLAKDARRLQHRDPGPDVAVSVPPATADEHPATKQAKVDPNHSFAAPFRVLDVGSCFNPLRVHKDLDVTALDLAPATPEVLRADFLQCFSSGQEGPAAELCPHSFDVVVMHYVLSYMPSPWLRYKCIQQARRALRPNGLLILTDPDSSKQNKNGPRMAAGWRRAIQSCKFRRVAYERLPHCHAMSFRAVEQPHLVDADVYVASSAQKLGQGP
ncbi:uncharacterized protein MONBRDRAFT_22269 [Monosiga brevicollis MX1]|uniref:Uncharacterized protein n=1 Tax=Monosiga brevicollis TaxID=81824 RepID=A9UQ29_MONBE|nr:uncharacterized protein MONBRDRAFT_22269 [Monosiga brevicollis MX1]EDQ92975.1 predicted protein [Monosiga brevicollis MX1]|eukprot:XP_001742737.1 hypothetical protein [Monosiga brevicollis MX1]